MKIVVVGAGTLGSAVQKVLSDLRHDVIDVARQGGTHQADITDVGGLRTLFADLAPFDAVASAAGDVFPAPLAESTDEQWARSIEAKGMGQINVVRAALPHISDDGSFTLVSGILGDEFTPASSIGTTVNRMVEGFVMAAATELPRGVRINCISPTVLAESSAYHPYFAGFEPVPAADVALAYVRAISNPITGRVLKVHNP
ncbi:MAG TPA: short chain dehydrogenase [Solirubrobacteraceae bacterium]|jgi:NAD(P)-dependent dehydrogenase (short-subunit alcohol dehydrogenase family)|nr:short chain dehydrogenase [Solirubrobacteraceae bacterium]